MLRGKSMGVTEEHRARRVVGPPSHLRAGFKSKQPGGSFGKESACNTGDPGSIPGSGRSREKEMATHSSYSCLENSMERGV